MKKNLYLLFIPLAFLFITGFTFQDVVNKAKEMSAKPYQAPPENIPEFLRSMGYDRWRDIRFKKDKALWHDKKLPFQVEFFHLGGFYTRKITINTIDHFGRMATVPFSTELFDYGKEQLPGEVPADAGFAGFRIHYPFRTKRYYDEFVVFLGASYLRAVGQGQQYGSSARGLAVDTATNNGEEFPYFTEFWINQPAKGDKEILIFGLLESPSLTGAYSFRIQPGFETVFNVKATLFFRKKVKKLGLAPLTGMYYHGENDRHPSIEDFRPEAHDCDGLILASSTGEWIWRPVLNPDRLLVNTFLEEQVKGFGLLQRDEEFHNYEDLEARFDIRPSIWIKPVGKWGPGHVELVQIPTANEYNDNIVAFWHPKDIPDQGKIFDFAYKMVWYSPKSNKNFSSNLGQVTSTRRMALADGGIRFIIEFQGQELKPRRAETEPQADVNISHLYKLAGTQLIQNDVTGGIRLVLNLVPENKEDIKKITPGSVPAVELRAFLKNNKRRLSETWSYLIEL